MMVVLGLVIELGANQRARLISSADNASLHKQASEAVREATLARERTAVTESNNLMLRSNVAELELAVQWRTITKDQEANLVKFFRNSRPLLSGLQAQNTNLVSVQTEQTDVEAFWYSKRIVEVLRKCGFNASLEMRLSFPDPERSGPFVGLAFTVKNAYSSANGLFLPAKGNAGVIWAAFRGNGMEPTSVWTDTNMVDGDLRILVGHKPGG